LTIWQYGISSAEITKTHTFRLYFAAILPTGDIDIIMHNTQESSQAEIQEIVREAR